MSATTSYRKNAAGIECGENCFLAVYVELVFDGTSGTALLNTLLRLIEAAQSSWRSAPAVAQPL